MKILLGAAIAVAALACSACSTMSPASRDELTAAIAARIQTCHITGSTSAGIGGIAGTGTGIQHSAQFDCPAQAPSAPGQVSAPAVTVLNHE